MLLPSYDWQITQEQELLVGVSGALRHYICNRKIASFAHKSTRLAESAEPYRVLIKWSIIRTIKVSNCDSTALLPFDLQIYPRDHPPLGWNMRKEDGASESQQLMPPWAWHEANQCRKQSTSKCRRLLQWECDKVTAWIPESGELHRRHQHSRAPRELKANVKVSVEVSPFH